MVRTSVTGRIIYDKIQLQNQKFFSCFNPYYGSLQTYIYILIWFKTNKTKKRITDTWITTYWEVLYILGCWAHKAYITDQRCWWLPDSCIYLMVCRHSALLPRFALGSIRSSLHRQDGWWVKQIELWSIRWHGLCQWFANKNIKRNKKLPSRYIAC